MEQFLALEGEEQSAVVATYRAKNQIESVVAKAQADKERASQKKKGSPGKRR